jgi:hypothetical protein
MLDYEVVEDTSIANYVSLKAIPLNSVFEEACPKPEAHTITHENWECGSMAWP